MQKFLATLLTFFSLMALKANAGDKEDIINLVHYWNDLHNTRETSVFKNIYAPNVLFYGRYMSRLKCFQKKDAFLNRYFKQEIISPITLNYYS